jgi:alkylation response protein AidB-like acyl-CoA dehydrogenase
MDFEYNDDQSQLAQSLRKYLSSACDFYLKRRPADGGSPAGEAAWSAMAAMGVLGLPFSLEDGGFGGGAVDLMAPMEALGEFLLTEPILDHVALAGRLIARAGDASQRRTWLPSLCDGSRRASFAFLEPDRRFALAPVATTARRSAQGWQLDGCKLMIDGAPEANVMVVSACTEGGASLFLVERANPGLRINGYRTLDGRLAGDAWFDAADLPAEALLGQEGAALPQIEEAVDFASALLCSDAVGAMSSANDTTLAFLKSRQQFGVPLGSFQALQHRMVEMFMACEQARSMAILAACRVDAAVANDPGSVAKRMAAVSAAMVCILEAARLISQDSVQMHGAMGMTDDLKISHTFRRLTALAHRFGDIDHHIERYARFS